MQGEEDFVPLGHLAVAGDISGGHKWGREYVTGIYGVEVRDVIKQPTYTRLPLKQRNHPVWSVNNAQIENPWFTSLTFNVITDMVRLKSIFLLFVFSVLHSLLSPFIPLFSIEYIFHDCIFSPWAYRL